jgi:hypothetical protein
LILLAVEISDYFSEDPQARKVDPFLLLAGNFRNRRSEIPTAFQRKADIEEQAFPSARNPHN